MTQGSINGPQPRPSRSAGQGTAPERSAGGSTDHRSGVRFNSGTLVPPSPPRRSGGGSPPDPKALFNAFRRRWFLAISLGLVCGGLAAAVVWVLVPAPYTAFSELWIRSKPHHILVERSESRSRFQTYKETQMRRVRDPMVLNNVLQRPEISELSLVEQRRRPVEWLERQLEVAAPATEFIRVSLSGEKPRELAALVNAVSEVYLNEVVGKERAQRSARLEELRRVRRQKVQELQEKREALKRIAESHRTANPQTLTAIQQANVEYYSRLQQEFVATRVALQRARIQLDVMQSGPDAAEENEISDAFLDRAVSRDPRYQELQSRVTQWEKYLDRAEETHTEGHQKLVKARDKLEQLQAERKRVQKELRPQVLAELQRRSLAEQQLTEVQLQEKVRHLEALRDELQAQIADRKAEDRETGLLSLRLEGLRRDIEQTERITDEIQNEISTLEIERESDPRITLSREAEVPHLRNTTIKYQLSGFAGFGIFGVIVGGIVWLEFRSRRISALDEVSEELNMPVVGALPQMPRSVTNGRRGRGSGHSAFWQNLLTESIDSARTMLLRQARRDSLQAVMISSATTGEGKTTLSCHLATSLARAGRAVLLIDCDLRWPTVHGVFGESLTPGMCEILREESALAEGLRSTSVGGLSILPAGEVDQTTLRALSLDRLDPLLEEAKRTFDFIIIDTSPTLPVSDSLLVAQHADAVMLSIRRDVSRVAKVAAACQRLEMIEAPLLGAVVIGLDDSAYGSGPPYRLGNGAPNRVRRNGAGG